MKFLVLTSHLLLVLIKSQPRAALAQCGQGKISNNQHFCIEPQFIEGCVDYESQKKCSKCEPGYQLSNKGACDALQYLPKKQKLIGCIKRDNEDYQICLNCANGFIRRNGKCATGVKNCAKYSANNSCKQCRPNYTLVLNQCRYNNLLGCSKIGLNHTCQSCQQPFKFNGSDCFIQDCKSFNDYGCVTCQCGYFLLSDRTCRKIQQGCLRYERGRCMNCVQHYKLKGGVCQIQGCLKYKNQTCIQCKLHYKNQHGGCIFQNCIDWINDFCITCKDKYKNERGVCVKQQDKQCFG